MLSRGGPMLPLDKWEKTLPERISYGHEHNARIIGSICCSSLNNWVDYARIADQLGVDMIELNLGNPHGGAADKPAGYLLGQSMDASAEVVRETASVTEKPLIVKLTPQVDDMVPFARAMISNGAFAVNVMHRYQGFRVDIDKAEPLLGGWAGVGGPWMKSISLAWISKIFNQNMGPIMGGNGVCSWQDVVEYLMSGATAVQFASVLMVRGPEYIKEMLTGFENYLIEKDYHKAEEIIGIAAKKALTYKELNKIKDVCYVNNPEICQRCPIDFKCTDFCYFGAIQKVGTQVRFLDTCNGCGLCNDICRVPGAISLK
ncbi:tRNA-dihydrouridine synthase, partial [Chloroflexota bacterium]